MLEGFIEVPILQGSSFISLTDNGLNFNKNIVKHMQRAESIKLLRNSSSKQLAIKKCNKNDENSIPFYRDEKDLISGVRFNNREVQQMIATMMNWNLNEYNYRIDGFLADDGETMIFNLNCARKFPKKNKPTTNA